MNQLSLPFVVELLMVKNKPPTTTKFATTITSKIMTSPTTIR